MLKALEIFSRLRKIEALQARKSREGPRGGSHHYGDAGPLLARFGYAAVALYLISMAVITVVAVYLATETYRRDLYSDEVEGAAATSV